MARSKRNEDHEPTQTTLPEAAETNGDDTASIKPTRSSRRMSAELQAMATVERALEELDDAARERVMTWMTDRWLYTKAASVKIGRLEVEAITGCDVD